MKVFVSVLFLLFSYTLASACSCMVPTEASKLEAIKEASVIFYGKVISVDPGEDSRQIKAKFQVLKRWKGLEKQEIVVTTASDSAACGVNFNVGESIMIYSLENPPSANSCTMLLVDEKLVRETLGEGKSFETKAPPPAENGRKKGFLTRFWRKITSVFS